MKCDYCGRTIVDGVSYEVRGGSMCSECHYNEEQLLAELATSEALEEDSIPAT